MNEIELSLPDPNPNWNWKQVYYTVLLEGPASGEEHGTVLGSGATPEEAKRTAIAILLSKTKSLDFAESLTARIPGLKRDTKIVVYKTEMVMRYCEARVHIYGQRLGYETMMYGYDPNQVEHFIRFIGFKGITESHKFDDVGDEYVKRAR